VKASTNPYRALTGEARSRIRDSGLSIAAYVRYHSGGDLEWYGDECGCSDDRCIGYHHDDNDDCGCLPVLIEMAQEAPR
jgi:hypothetical protein